ncbi:MAG: glycosyltransferase family 4 protein [Candidatus Aegiribacteria sp.]|nr:glycosyltransferase family 4 protein [Candidatus Aegiribacteria sp.]
MNNSIPVVYADSLANRGGTGVYLRRLLEGFIQCKAHVLAAAAKRLMKPSEALDTDLSARGIMKVFHENITLPALVKSVSPSIVHLPAFAGRPPGGVPCAVTLHDLAFMANTSWFPRLRSVYYRLYFRRVAKKADVLMVDSDFTGREAIRRLGVGSERIRKVYLSTESMQLDPEIFRKSTGIRDRYILFVGTVEPRKNISGLLTAWNAVSQEHPDLKLVIAGRWGWGPAVLKDHLRKSSGVIWTGQLSDSILKSCITGAELLVYPSFYEGFGLPPLEAASAGVPSVVTPAEALVEIFSEISNIALNHNPDSIAGAILESLDTVYDKKKLIEFASGFSVKRMAEEVLGVYREFSK